MKKKNICIYICKFYKIYFCVCVTQNEGNNKYYFISEKN